MILNFSSFKDILEQLVKYRSKNYVNTTCDISVLISSVYSEISTEVNLAYHIQELELYDDTYRYKLPAFITKPSNNNINEFYESYLTDIYDIVDKDGCDVSNYFTQVGNGELILNDKNPFNMSNDIIYVLRKKIPDIKELEPPMYDMIQKAMIEGIMFNIQDSVPSQTDGQLANLQYQRFFNAKKDLKLKLPQFEWFDVVGIGTNPYSNNSKGL